MCLKRSLVQPAFHSSAPACYPILLMLHCLWLILRSEPVQVIIVQTLILSTLAEIPPRDSPCDISMPPTCLTSSLALHPTYFLHCVLILFSLCYFYLQRSYKPWEGKTSPVLLVVRYLVAETAHTTTNTELLSHLLHFGFLNKFVIWPLDGIRVLCIGLSNSEAVFVELLSK